MSVYQVKCGSIKKSYYNNPVRHLVDNYHPEPVHLAISNKKKWTEKISVDYPKSYSNAVVKYFDDVKLPVLNVCDNFVKDDFIINSVDKNEVYLIADVYYRGILYCEKSLYPYFVVNELIKNGIIVRCLGYIQYNEFIDGTFIR